MEQGLSLPDVQKLQKLHGKNEISAQSSFSALSLFLSQFPTFINGILAAAAILSLITHEQIDAFFILAIILLNAVLGFIQEYQAEKALEKLKNLTTPISRVIRNGHEQQVSSRDLVPGDIVILSEGDKVPADGVLFSVHHIEIDEAILTGESLPVIKSEHDKALLGTLVTKGKSLLTVERIGMETDFGQIAKSLSDIKQDITPLQKNISVLGRTLSLTALFIAFLIIPIGFLHGQQILPLLLLAVSIGIAAIPEGLPTVITIALALGTSRMAKRNAIIRKMPAVETLGSVQIILTDKTGTLTQNKMRVKETWAYTKGNPTDILRACVLGTTASLVEKGDKNFDIIGDPTDGSLLLWAEKTHPSYRTEHLKGKLIDEFVFDTRTKTITTVWEEKNKQFAYVRGAPESILANSTLTQKEKDNVNEQIHMFAKNGLRVIGFAMKSIIHEQGMSREMIEKDLQFLGIFGIYDPPRPEVKQAVLEAKQAGIRTVMVTGDNELTALAIAKEVGIIERDEHVITGDELAKRTDKELLEILETVRVFARTKPHDKLRLVSLYKQLGRVIGVTGDGVNDSLALKKADVGIAMGKSGTDVAKEASDVILTDDNYATLIKAVEEGRSIYQNIIKAISYLLTGNLSELSLVFFATVFGMPIPLLPTQILWINLVTDGLPALALASDAKSPGLLKEQPRDPNRPILTTPRIKQIGFLGIGLGLYLLGVFAVLLHFFEENVARTLIFNLLIISHILIAFYIRNQSLRKINKLLLFSAITTILLQIIITTVPFFQKIFHIGF